MSDSEGAKGGTGRNIARMSLGETEAAGGGYVYPLSAGNFDVLQTCQHVTRLARAPRWVDSSHGTPTRVI